MTPTKPCEACGLEFAKHPKKTHAEFAARRFCSKACANRTVPRAGRVPATHCRAGLHKMTGDNVRVDGQGRRKGCKACAAATERDRKSRLRGHRVVPRGARKRPTSQPVVEAVPVSERPVWRPAGFAARPNVRQAS